jgi:hypothetical protein
LETINLLIVLLLSYFTDCAFNNRLLVLDVLLKEQVTKNILGACVWLIPLLGFAYIVIYFIVEYRRSDAIAEVVYENVCREIFNRYIRNKSSLSQDLVKVSLLKSFDRHTNKPYLKVVGRYQTKVPKRKSKVRFYAGEGCAGIAYQSGYLVNKSVNKFDPKDPSKYYSECQEAFKLPHPKTRALNDKACEFLCIPIRYFGEDEPWGVLSLDYMEKGFITSEEAREIEGIISCFSVLLMP